ncbi:MAG: SMP-30/gluconolactonase/LRE family protein, partial [Solirubrobacterales bacterium]|nr:SMP-30/gluconolactonase/LRE family protein [Solirubrobacterales bacterium]
RLLTCEQGLRRVTRTEHDGSITILVETHEGKRFNSPNDAVVRSDGSIWFTDPTYGIDADYEGYRAKSEIGSNRVYRLDPESGECRVVADDFVQPNGLAFSPDERRLYIADTGATHHPEGPRHIRAFHVEGAEKLSDGEVLATCAAGLFDGFRLDEEGRIWTSAGDGVHCLLPDGTLIGKIRVPETVANVAFGGLRRTRLFICASSSLYAVHLAVKGAPGVVGPGVP